MKQTRLSGHLHDVVNEKENAGFSKKRNPTSFSWWTEGIEPLIFYVVSRLFRLLCDISCDTFSKCFNIFVLLGCFKINDIAIDGFHYVTGPAARCKIVLIRHTDGVHDRGA